MTAPDTEVAAATPDSAPAGQGATTDDAARTVLRDPRGVIALLLLLLLFTLSLIGPMVYRLDPETLDLANAGRGPTTGHPLGTDESGRDVLSRLLHGGRVSLAVGFAAMTVSVIAGLCIGGVAGAWRGWPDTLLMRLTDAALSIPAILLVITIVALLGQSITTLVIAIGATSWMGLARLVRGELLSMRERPFVEAAHALGAAPFPVFTRHLLPHLWPTVLVNATLGVGSAILTESALSFLGLGVEPPRASWGNMLSGAQVYVFSDPWRAAYPGVVIMLTVVAINLLGDALRDALPG